METMADYAKELEASFRTIQEGDVMTGTVIDINEEEITLDLHYYAQGIIKIKDYTNDPTFQVLEEVKVGDEVEASVVRMDDGNGNIQLSRVEANDMLAWDKFRDMQAQEKVVTVKVAESVNGGAVAYLEGIRGFIPASKLALDYVEDASSYVGKQLKVKVITANAEEKKLVLSAKEVLLEQEKEKRQHKISMIVPGTIVEGTVESLQNYGAFVSLGDGISGLVHISQICEKRIRKPSEVLAVGDKVKVKILNTNDGKVSLSIKEAAESEAAEELAEEFEYASSESVSTSLGDLLSKFKFD